MHSHSTEYVPAPHAIQPSAAASPAPRYWPLVQDAHAEDPTNEDEPSAHGEQEADPIELEKFPAPEYDYKIDLGWDYENHRLGLS